MQFSLTDTSDTEYTGFMESYIHALDANLHRLYPLEFENFTTSTESTCRRSMDIFTSTKLYFLSCMSTARVKDPIYSRVRRNVT